MSFFKKMVDKIEDLVGDDDKKKADNKEEKIEGTKDHTSYDGAAFSHQPQYEQQAQYGQQQTYGAPPSHPPSNAGPPQLPPGWISQWDPNSQRYYYLEQATGRTQWDPPQPYNQSGFAPPPMGASGVAHNSYGGQHGQPSGYYSQETTHTFQDSHGGVKEVTEKKEKKSGKGGMLAAGAGGLAVGAVGGAVLAHEMGEDSSDDEHHGEHYQQQPAYVQQTTYYQEPAPSGPPPLEPPPPGDHSSVSSSDKEDLAEAREEYENASDASDREEAREDYNEAYEEAYD
ncbi:MAG: hypothetical protein L6R41_000295 [Letrouitia leprolyta]|nr:MAG: hypothetical protein L6R41_000295 [Letrouitia leprolyta]